MKKVAILGSTGSIGTQTLEIIRDNEDLQAVALAAGQNVDLMEKQIREFHPQIAGMWSEEAAADLRQREFPIFRSKSCAGWTDCWKSRLSRKATLSLRRWSA